MKKSKFSEEQIAYVLRQAESGTAVAAFCLAECVCDLLFAGASTPSSVGLVTEAGVSTANIPPEFPTPDVLTLSGYLSRELARCSCLGDASIA
jgi:hypothetical protein